MERLSGYQRHVESRLAAFGAEIVSAGLVDTAPAAVAASDLFIRENVKVIVCYVATYATSAQVLPAVQHAKRPVLVLASTHAATRLRKYNDGGVVGELLRVLRPGDFQRLCAQPHRFSM